MVESVLVSQGVLLSPIGAVGGEGSAASFSPILDHKPTTDTLDDEFNSGTLDGSWTVTSGSSGTVDPLETGEVEIYDLTTRSGWLLIQAGNDGTKSVAMRKDLTLADGASVIVAVSVSAHLDAALTNNETQFTLSLNDNDTLGGGNYVELSVATRASSDTVTLGSWDGSVGVESLESVTTELIFVRIARVGTVYTLSFTHDGTTWATLREIDHSAVLDNIWIAGNNLAAGTDPVPIIAIDWIRQGTNALDPWAHSPLVTVAQVEDWTSFSPVWKASSTDPVINNGALFGKYKRLGTAVTLSVTMLAGSSTTFGSGSWFFEFPVGLGIEDSTREFQHVGAMHILETGSRWWTGYAYMGTPGLNIIRMVSDDNRLDSTNPMTWGDGDELTFELTYETDFS